MTYAEHITIPALLAAMLAFAPSALAEPIAPVTQPVRDNEPDDIYAEIEEAEEAAPEGATELPEADFSVTSIVEKPTLAQQIALGVGFGGLALGTLTAAGSVDEPTTGSIVLSSTSLGLAVIGFATAGIIEIFDDDEPVNVTVGPGFFGARVPF